jgi:hypothetical protein
MSARITYNSKNLDFTVTPYLFPAPPFDYPGVESRSISGKCERLGVGVDALVSVGFRNFLSSDATDSALKRKLHQWWQWAKDGQSWTFAWDSGEVVNTLLNGGVAAGATVITLDSTTGIDASGLYVIRSANRAELVHIASVDSGTQVTLTDTLNFAYPDNSRFRSERYWPARLPAGAPFPIRNDDFGLRWSFELSFYEDVNSL